MLLLTANVQAVELLQPPIAVAGGGTGDAITSDGRAISGDGRFVVFSSYATNLVAGDSNGMRDVFLWDTQLDSVALISRAENGAQANGDSVSAVISADGGWVAFASAASNLTADSNGAVADIFLFDRATEQLALVSISSDGAQSAQPANNPDINANGRYITFDTTGDLAAGAGSQVRNVFRRDNWTDNTALISRAATGGAPDAMSLDAQMSADGKRIVFVSMGTNLVSTPTVGKDSYLFEQTNSPFGVAGVTGNISLLSLTASGTAGDGISYFPSISGDGTTVAFHTNASNLVSGDEADVTDIVLRDLATGDFELLSRTAAGTGANDHNTHPSLSYDGNLVAYRTDATNLVPNDVAGHGDIVVFDRTTATTALLSANAAGAFGNNGSWAPSISLDGRRVAFWSQASNLSADGTPFGDALVAVPEQATSVPVAFSAAVLPSSRSAQIGSELTVFASVIGTGIAGNCRVELVSALDIEMSYQATSPETNAVVGAANAPFLLLPGIPQTILLRVQPNEAVVAEELSFDFACDPGSAPVALGTNTLLVTAASVQPPDVVALLATLDNNGIVSLPAGGGAGFFSVASANVGTAGDFMVRPVVQGQPLDALSICETNPVTAECLSPVGAAVSVSIASGDTNTFAVFVSNAEAVPFLPGANRLSVRFEDAAGVVRGRTSVAVRSLPQ